MNILLDYFFPITVITPTPQASTAFLKQVCFVGKKISMGTDGVITKCTSNTDIAALVTAQAADDAAQLIAAGMQAVYVLVNEDLDLDDILVGHESDFFTIVLSSEFTATDIATADFGAFKGVVAVSDTDDTALATAAAVSNYCAFHTTSGNKAKNMCFAIGSLLSNANDWKNQQYIPMPFADDVANLGKCTSLFNSKISFVINDDQFGKRLGLLAAGGKAIVAPYIIKNLSVDMQSAALSYISGNEPAYTKKEGALLEDELRKVIQSYIDRGWIEAGTIAIALDQGNFVASGNINVAEPKALWRVVGEMLETL
jgi:hypothetical protein